jgi:hypothetical protein
MISTIWYFIFSKPERELGVVAYNSSTWEAEAGGS